MKIEVSFLEPEWKRNVHEVQTRMQFEWEWDGTQTQMYIGNATGTMMELHGIHMHYEWDINKITLVYDWKATGMGMTYM